MNSNTNNKGLHTEPSTTTLRNHEPSLPEALISSMRTVPGHLIKTVYGLRRTAAVCSHHSENERPSRSKASVAGCKV